MQSANTFSAPVSDLSSVIQIIESSDGLGAPRQMSVKQSVSQSAGKPPARNQKAALPKSTAPATHLKLHVHSEIESAVTPDQATDQSVDDIMQLETAPAEQVEQLVNHLRTRQKDLEQREADLQSQTYKWETQKLAAEASLRKRNSHLNQHLSQVRRQQEQLISLQQKLVDNQEAISKLVERLVGDVETNQLKSYLQELQQQLNETFSSNFRHWENLKCGLETAESTA